MTGTDPAVEAARRARRKQLVGFPTDDAYAEASAYAALKPIRAALRAMGEVLDKHGTGMTTDDLAALLVHTITEIEKHAFTTTELEDNDD